MRGQTRGKCAEGLRVERARGGEREDGERWWGGESKDEWIRGREGEVIRPRETATCSEESGRWRQVAHTCTHACKRAHTSIKRAYDRVEKLRADQLLHPAAIRVLWSHVAHSLTLRGGTKGGDIGKRTSGREGGREEGERLAGREHRCP